MDSDLLPLARPGIDRDARQRGRAELIGELRAQAGTRVVHVREGRVAATSQPDGDPRLVLDVAATDRSLWLYLGRDEEAAYLAAVEEASEQTSRRTDDPQGASSANYLSIRDVGWQLSGRDAALAATALALANWHATHRFCPRCGTATEIIDAGWVRRCPVDSSQHFPRTDPAVIMAITDPDDRLLLGHATHWPEGQYSVPAGFVEPGESLEAAVRREVHEETAVRVDEVTYRASQPWPFPASLMLGFRGRTQDREPAPDGVEISAAQFVTRDEVTRACANGSMRLPRPTSIACSLIEEWFGRPLPR
ncbi:NAD(+) diphosphatase [Ruania alkalisoli]|uniref:NAD(+) diphosphatase n=1 Tax=Ruania alkalisoli TaxID=2779775 RepID=A0A7M1SW41_9MICO|nr:NAD(+) diphosphatase [Ruania alkalisoli]QOR71779.1 NAD(+) diphosphatase [Ruania alkalisoli]